MDFGQSKQLPQVSQLAFAELLVNLSTAGSTPLPKVLSALDEHQQAAISSSLAKLGIETGEGPVGTRYVRVCLHCTQSTMQMAISVLLICLNVQGCRICLQSGRLAAAIVNKRLRARSFIVSGGNEQTFCILSQKPPVALAKCQGMSCGCQKHARTEILMACCAECG